MIQLFLALFNFFWVTENDLDLCSAMTTFVFLCGNDNVCVSLWYKSPGKHLFVASKRGWYKSSGNDFHLKFGNTSIIDLVKTRILASATTCVVEGSSDTGEERIVFPAG